jgi:hypothetical protein
MVIFDHNPLSPELVAAFVGEVQAQLGQDRQGSTVAGCAES